MLEPYKYLMSFYLSHVNTSMRKHFTLICIAFLSLATFFVPTNVFASTTLPRLSGSDRYETAIAISQDGWETSENVILATGNDFPDALSAAPLAKQLNAPILLTTSDSISTELESELQRLKCKNIYLIGGDGVISENLEDKLQEMKFGVIRISGNDRYETSLKIASYLFENFNVSSEIAVATGDDFPDALSMAPIAASNDIPIILSPKTDVSVEFKTFLTDHKVSKAFIIGGTGVISDQVSQQLPNPERLWGTDRYKTNIAILNKFLDSINFDKTYVATGTDFPDALAGAAIAAKSKSSIILASEYGVGISSSALYSEKINQLQSLGGEGALTPASLQQVKSTIDYGEDYQLGNSSANLANQGYAAEQGDYVYFYQKTSDTNSGAIYKMQKDGTNKIKLCDTGTDNTPSPSINVVGDWVYYRYSTPVKYLINDNTSSSAPTWGTAYSGSIYKVRTDGTQNTKISGDNARKITVIDGWIYYYNSKYSNTDQTNEQGIYKMKTDGSQKIRLVDFGPTTYDIGFIRNISDGYIFYYDDMATYRMNLDGSQKTKIIDNDSMIYGTRDWLYFIVGDFATSNQIYKTRPDGSESTVLYNGASTGNWLNVSADYVYFTVSNDGVYKVKTDGTGLTKITDDSVSHGRSMNLNYIDDTMYYNIYYSNYGLSQTYQVKADGSLNPMTP